jgi:hypothetical protein
VSRVTRFDMKKGWFKQQLEGGWMAYGMFEEL